jgi:hypothetical protein
MLQREQEAGSAAAKLKVLCFRSEFGAGSAMPPISTSKQIHTPLMHMRKAAF